MLFYARKGENYCNGSIRKPAKDLPFAVQMPSDRENALPAGQNKICKSAALHKKQSLKTRVTVFYYLKYFYKRLMCCFCVSGVERFYASGRNRIVFCQYRIRYAVDISQRFLVAAVALVFDNQILPNSQCV